MTRDRDLFIFAGEKSGDLHGGNLLKVLKQQQPDLAITGVGGPEMRTQGLRCFLQTEDFEAIGFVDILWSLPKIMQQFYQVRNHILKTRPKIVLLIDYPGFNLRLARALRKKGFQGKIIQYISPTVWAWGKGRIQEMVDTLDLLLTIYPFEKELFTHTPLKVEYVGNPIYEAIDQHRYHSNWKQILGIKSDRLISLFPGSRKGEIQKNLPDQLETARLLKQRNSDLGFGISCAHIEVMPVMSEILEGNSLKLNQDVFLIPQAYRYELMRDSYTAIAKSGSVTLELALHQRPSVVTYKISPLNRWIAKYLLRLNLPYYCIANILKNEEVFPEFVKEKPSPKKIFLEVNRLSEDSTARAVCMSKCHELQQMLKHSSPSQKIAQILGEMLEC